MNVPTSRHLVGGLVEPKFAHGKNCEPNLIVTEN